MSDNSISSQVYISRDQIRNQIISSIKDYLELGNVDLTKSSFLSFVVNTISTLTSNLFFYNVSTYREFFLTLAQLPESIYNLSSFLGYIPDNASFSTTYVMMTVPMGFYDPGNPTVTFRMPSGFEFKASDIIFRTFYETVVSITNNTSVEAKIVLDDGREISLPVYIDTTTDPAQFYFSLPVRQLISDTQQSQIQPDLQPYVFTSVDLNLTDQLANISVAVGDPSNTYTEYGSLYLIPVGTKGFVAEKRSFGRRIYFGNGFIGVQPSPGDTVYITYETTKGETGNVIAGSITTGDRIYSELSSGEVRVVEYSCFNPSQATGGKDEESIDDIRTNAIKNITSLSRFVSEQDFHNINVIIPDSPYGDNSFPLLKRSDVRCNEIQLYTTLNYLSETVPTRNIWYEVSSDTTSIPKYTPLLFGTDLYYNIFDLTIDKLNGFGYYKYIVSDIKITPTLVTVYDPYYTSLNISELEIFNLTGTSQVDFYLNYNGTDTSASCYFVIEETGDRYEMINDSSNNRFTYTFTSYNLFPEGNNTVKFTLCKDVYSMPDPVYLYTTSILVSQNLKNSMMSNVLTDSTSGNLIIYDIPTIDKTYYDHISDKIDFESVCIQSLVLSQDFENYRMLTDFINVKFADTTGTLIGMQLNLPNKTKVIDFISIPPTTPLLGDRYIVDPDTTYSTEMRSHKNWYMQCTGFILPGLPRWEFIEPTTNDIVYISNLQKNYIFTGVQWIYPEYDIPLNIVVEVYKAPDYYGSDRELVEAVKDSLITTISPYFGINGTIRKSQIITCVHNTVGVTYCHLVEPMTDIFFDFDINKFERLDLLKYSPEYIFFNRNTINVKIITPFER